MNSYIGDPDVPDVSDVPDVPDVFNVFDVLVSNMENAAAAVAVKAPPFISSNPATWFVILEAQFNIKMSNYHGRMMREDRSSN